MALRKGTPTGTVTWASGENFNGYLLVGLVLPTDTDDDNWPEANFGATLPSSRLPQWASIPIRDGVYLSGIGVLYNADVSPPNSAYSAYYYDLALKQVAGPSALFQVTTPTFSVPALTLTAPTAGTVAPTPEASVTAGSTTVTYVSAPSIETPSGTMNGVNATFTLSKTPIAAHIFYNGVHLVAGVGYTLTAATITMQAGYIPSSGDSLVALLW